LSFIYALTLISGKKDLTAVLLPTRQREGSPSRDDKFLSLSQTATSSSDSAHSSTEFGMSIWGSKENNTFLL